jgi:hypothetical protein
MIRYLRSLFAEWHAERPEHDPMFGPIQEMR